MCYRTGKQRAEEGTQEGFQERELERHEGKERRKEPEDGQVGPQAPQALQGPATVMGRKRQGMAGEEGLLEEFIRWDHGGGGASLVWGPGRG